MAIWPFMDRDSAFAAIFEEWMASHASPRVIATQIYGERVASIHLSSHNSPRNLFILISTDRYLCISMITLVGLPKCGTTAVYDLLARYKNVILMSEKVTKPS